MTIKHYTDGRTVITLNSTETRQLMSIPAAATTLVKAVTEVVIYTQEAEVMHIEGSHQ